MVQYYYFSTLLVFTINILFFGTFISYIIFFFFYKNQYQNIIKHDSVYNLIKILLLLSLCVSFLFFIMFLFFFFNYCLLLDNYNIFTCYYILPKIYYSNSFLAFEFYVDLFGIVLLFLGYFVGILSLMALDNRIFYKNIKYLFILNVFVTIVFFYVFSTNILMFFLFYEFLVIPSFLVVYYISPSRRAVQASLYFLIWTQIGSFLVLLVIAYIITVVGSGSFNDIKAYNFSYNESSALFLLLFLGFGFKVPLWPFHY